jgi:hypothetical protein
MMDWNSYDSSLTDTDQNYRIWINTMGWDMHDFVQWPRMVTEMFIGGGEIDEDSEEASKHAAKVLDE